MRILFISSYYPPHFIGGWEQLVRDISEMLMERGHITHILTSMHGVDKPIVEGNVSRLLHPESDVYNYDPIRELKHKRMLDENLNRTEEVIRTFEPDIVFVHLMYNMTKGVPWVAEQLMPDQIAYWVANDWPYAIDPHTAYWTDKVGNPIKQALKSVVGRFPLATTRHENERFQLEFRHVMCVSQAILESLNKEAGIPLSSLSVLHNGVETNLFKPNENQNRLANKLKLLYAGSVNEHKGVHTILEALDYLQSKSQLNGISLSIVGGGHHDYEARLRRYVTDHQLDFYVTFYGKVPRSEMHKLLNDFDVLVFPSIWEEPLSRMMQEGMSAGLTVVGTLTGGSGELLVEGETGLTFEKANYTQLAERLLELQSNPELRERLAKNGRQEVVQRFSMEHMVDRIEERLSEIISKQLPI